MSLPHPPPPLPPSSYPTYEPQQQPPQKRARLQRSERPESLAAAVTQAVQAALDLTATATSSNQPASSSSSSSSWEAGLSSIISAYAAPRLQYHVLCSSQDLDDVDSFDLANDMRRHLRRRYNKPAKREAKGTVQSERSEEEEESKLVAKSVRLMKQHKEKVREAQREDEEMGESDDSPFDDEIALLRAQRLTLADGPTRERRAPTETWSMSASPPLSASLAPLQPPYILFQQSNLRSKRRFRDSWRLRQLDTDEELALELRDFLGGVYGLDADNAEREWQENQEMQLTDLVRRALWRADREADNKGDSDYLAAIFHCATKVWDVYQ